MGDAAQSSSISRIAIIGGGPVGVSCAKYLLAEKAFDTIDIYEQRDGVGGIWNLSPPTRSKRIPIPQLDPFYGQKGSHAEEETLEFESPLYDYLETNIPKQLMAFSDKPFPDEEPLFPSHQAVLRYLNEYADEVRHLIRFHTAVRDVKQFIDSKTGQERWALQAEDLQTKQTISEEYDAVVVANGHYTVPYVPDIKGVAEWNATYPGHIIHSKAYRKPEDFTGKKVIVVGNSASGLDIATQIGKYCKTPVLLSARSVSAFGTLPPAEWRDDVDELVEFLPKKEGEYRAVRFRSGRVETDVDAVVFATGYFYSYPFLQTVSPQVVTDGFRTRDVYQHLFDIQHPTLAFPVINLKIIPFPLSQNQAAVLARVWSGRLDLPSTDEMRQWEQDTVKEKGDGKYFHLKKFPEDAAQINELYAWAESARKRQGLENDGAGKRGARWLERQVWLRSIFPNVKAAYLKKGEDRYKVRTIEELGFDFDEWRSKADDKELDMFQKAKCSLVSQ
ncbi:monooxygenase [Exophiala dermatitidis]|uniref:Dimethylaniline monooxygenase (N-oxide forming) n=2 Tax=Exophiala dermatitidis TaxID=5970 RepID=H6BX20_EXODN|nr:dimethylaniline monooxygenase (N-oxide forming) [Exophiala dermatitidis NIH/UT8656]KAJ4503142.1 monooxygenase [Exophiala dermatitidis]EHY55306.1 dimethylaniline monooxygenase (N-oxide forming) [Exophiala dermatitidis NIH/UT8656]KAJ4506188.1 monooxygenase [Exophiala dermatitidis]KAJ4508280.1 monooxygenase [Exophiala dermatitidis]KAJ4533284.1 monooxygenase [Exophiala dermatitidis]